MGLFNTIRVLHGAYRALAPAKPEPERQGGDMVAVLIAFAVGAIGLYYICTHQY
jgi:uncharacterized membrane protein YoaK (UPF0700 family)